MFITVGLTAIMMVAAFLAPRFRGPPELPLTEAFASLIEAHQPAEARDRPDMLNAYRVRMEMHEALEPIQRSFLRGDPCEPFLLDSQAVLTGHRDETALADELLALYEAAGVFDSLRLIAASPRAVRPPYGDDFTISRNADDTDQDEHLAVLLVHRFHSQIASGQWQDAVETYEWNLAQARLLAHQLTRPHYEAAASIVMLADEHLRAAIFDGALDEATLVAAQDARATQLAYWPPLHAVFDAERFVDYDYLNGPWGKADRKGKPAVDSVRDAAQVLARLSPADRATSPAAVTARAAIASYKNTDRLSRVQRDAGAGLNELISQIDVLHGDIRATCLVIALELHHLRTGDYPRSLSELTEQDLGPRVPRPPESYPLVYRQVRGTYTMYSVGYDLTNNGGRPHPAAPSAAMHRDGAGYDFVYR